ncbi:MAG: Serratia phage Parlo, partial [Pseudomonadota bacterium]
MATAADLIDLATGLLEDPGNDVWGRTELLEYLNDGLKALAAKRPDEFVTTAVVTLVEGPRQSLPDAYVALLRPLSN